MASGAGDAFSRRRWATTTSLLSSLAYLLLFYCSNWCLLVCVLWSNEGRSFRGMIWRRREWRLFDSVLPVVLSLQLTPPAMSREDSLAAALSWSSDAFPVAPPSGHRRSCRTVDSVIDLNSCKEHRFQLTISISPSPGRVETHKPPCSAPTQQIGTRSKDITSSAPSLPGKASFSISCNVIIYSTVWIFFAGGKDSSRRSSSGGLPFGTIERFRSAASCHALTVVNGLLLLYVWARPIDVIKFVSPKNCLPRPRIKGNPIQRSMVFGSASFRSSLFMEKSPPSYPLPMERDISSDSLPSVCFSFLIGLLPCVAVSTEPEGATKITSVIFVDEVWTPTSHYVTIRLLVDFVVKAPLTHSSTVSNSLSSSIEDLSCLVYLTNVVYACCQRGWIISSCYCIEQD